jgi:hypothetical protein
MKRIASLLLVTAFAGMILLPVTVTVNRLYSDRLNVADGNVPIPPIPPIGCDAISAALQA